MNSQPAGDVRKVGTDLMQTASLDGSVPNRSQIRTQAVWLVLAVLVLFISGGGAYLHLSSQSARPVSVAPTTPHDRTGADIARAPRSLSEEQLERMVAQALGQTQREPRNASAWGMLAHSYEMLGKFAESAKAYAVLVQLLPQDAQVLADYSDVLAVVNGRSFKGEPTALLKQALAIEPNNAKALVLAGSARFEEQDYAQAISYLERAKAAATDPVVQREIDLGIAQAKAVSGTVPETAVASAQGKASGSAIGAGSAARVSGRVDLADALRAKAPAQATLFVFARPVDGSRMPVALLRKKIGDLPLSFSLDDSMAMVPNVSLSKFSKVVVVARVSARGDITPAPGDLEGVSAPVTVNSKNLQLQITEVLK